MVDPWTTTLTGTGLVGLPGSLSSLVVLGSLGGLPVLLLSPVSLDFVLGRSGFGGCRFLFGLWSVSPSGFLLSSFSCPLCLSPMFYEQGEGDIDLD